MRATHKIKDKTYRKCSKFIEYLNNNKEEVKKDIEKTLTVLVGAGRGG